jgi:hypothetical protein
VDSAAEAVLVVLGHFEALEPAGPVLDLVDSVDPLQADEDQAGSEGCGSAIAMEETSQQML